MESLNDSASWMLFYLIGVLYVSSRGELSQLRDEAKKSTEAYEQGYAPTSTDDGFEGFGVAGISILSLIATGILLIPIGIDIWNLHLTTATAMNVVLVMVGIAGLSNCIEMWNIEGNFKDRTLGDVKWVNIVIGLLYLITTILLIGNHYLGMLGGWTF